MTAVKESFNASNDLIQFHGGALVNRRVPQNEVASLTQKAQSFPSLTLTETQLADIEMIAIGGFSPLEGFLTQEDYNSVVSTMRLADGTVWPIPIVLGVSAAEKSKLKPGQPAALVFNGEIQAVIHVEDIYQVDKNKEAAHVYQTEDNQHPGVAALLARGEWLVGGKIDVLKVQTHPQFPQYNMTPRDTRRLFKDKGWKTVVGFQTRNPIHRAHEYITKTALETVDGLLIHPLIGATKKGDIPADVRMKCYEILIKNYYPNDRVMLSINPSNMFYAGPREAVLHALVRQNYGCTHFIIGRDHAGVGNYYGTYDAHVLIKSFSREDLAITPLCFENSFWCKKMKGMATNKTTNSTEAERVHLSGTQVREMLAAGQMLPPEFSRPEVAQLLIGSNQ